MIVTFVLVLHGALQLVRAIKADALKMRLETYKQFSL